MKPLSIEHPPLWFILLTPCLVTLSIPFSYLIFTKYKEISVYLSEENKPLYNFLKNKWYFDEVYEIIFVRSLKKIGVYFWKKIDGLIIDRFGPDGISNVIKTLSNKAVKFQSGYFYLFAFIFLFGFSG
mgnify:CR=1 FL=1